MKHNKLFFAFMFLAAAFSMNLRAQFEFGKTPDIHVEGSQLVDPQGHPVRFFGFMDTPSAWFNGGRWGWSYDASGVTKCKQYFEKLFTATTDTLHGAFCNIFRLHLEPAWVDSGSNTCWFCGKTTAMGTAKGATCKSCGQRTFYQTGGKTYDPDDQEVGGEADVHKRSLSALKTHLGDVYVPIAESANKHGMYVVMRPPGVCPGKIKVGGYYQQFLIKVWDQVTKNAKVKKYSGWLSIELANEPVSVVDANGQDSKTAMRDFFQPVVDKIRENGFEGIIWVPGKGWQASYENYKDYPVVDANMGYAVHNYTGWYGGDDKAFTNGRTVAQYTNQFHNQVPVVDTNPIVITEVDWSPEKKSEEGKGHVNEHGDWVDGNYGTWATGSTSKWGVLYKGLLDKYDNISMTLSSTGCFIDIDATLANKGYVPVPAFKTAMERDGLDPWDGSGVACFQWYRDYYYAQHDGYSNDNITIKQLNTSSIKDIIVSPGGANYIKINATFLSGRKTDIQGSCTYEAADPTICKVWMGKVIGLAEGETDVTATYTDITGKAYSLTFHVTVTLFPLNKEAFNTAIQGSASISAATASVMSITTAKNGIAGWTYGTGIDISQYDTLTVSLAARPGSTSKAAVRFYDQADITGAYAEASIVGETETKILLKDLVKTDGKALNLKKICVVGFYTATSTTLRIKSLTLSKTAAEEDAIQRVNKDNSTITNIFDLNGMKADLTKKGVKVVRSTDGKAKKIIVK